MSLTMAGATALAAGAGAVGNLASTGLQYLGNKALQDDAQAFNAQEASNARQFAHDEAQLARDFEAQKYQRTIADMKAAGINPASVGMSPPSGGSPMASSAASASSGASSISNPNIGNILSSAFNSAMVESLQDERFARSLVERTAYHANLIDNQIKKVESQSKDYRLRTNAWKHKEQKTETKNGRRVYSDPKWLKSYVKNFDSSVEDL